MPRTLTGHLYLIHSKAQDAFKVGFATNPDTRIASLQSGNPDQLYIVGTVPIEEPAERVFHQVMKPHRIAREWYRDSEAALIFGVFCELQEFWGDKVEATYGGSQWPIMGDEKVNPGGVYITATEMRRRLPRAVEEMLASSDEDDD